jgi:hypothetical protein
MMRSVSLSCLLFCLPILCPGQTKPGVITDVAPAPSARFPASWYPPDSDVTYSIAAPTDAPYTATLVTTTRYIDPSTGQTKTITQNTLQARDAAGRQRNETEEPRPDAHGKIVMAHEVTISDPVSHCNFHWIEPWLARGKPTAIVTCMPRTLHYTNQNIWADALVSEPQEIQEVNTVFRSEPLGKKHFGDLEAVGVLRTKTQTNPQSGKIQKLVTETWYSPELKELLEMKVVPIPDADQASHIPDFELTNIHRTELDPSFFYPPAGYDITTGH